MCGVLSASREAFEMSELSSRKRPVQKPKEKPKKDQFKSTKYDAVDEHLKNVQDIIKCTTLF
ncbi:hypothetical protein ACY3WP_001565 [Acinetobacter baumannii]|uniref:hypothetical protein n=1 Tax=Acinetobacter baumannii TaxID=470 RepID=UPI001EBE6DA2|nr:hypothetical protein [Acinetobacter baumannii]EKT8680275.1 hypothetical protein [Acinetobacter baumannii]EKU0562236.1 hypothetical protein [Acinetobacter baumannii]EKU2508747.1 hypothetical protein [Acinetobacter baumannii]EKW2952615.1 hypothetical protein [Acinetobacter baumannii]EKW7200662.1 hypothetical protein [Acinetobacter baumannii]